ncbi:MAG: hydrogenase maturation protease [Bacillota bacterium]
MPEQDDNGRLLVLGIGNFLCGDDGIGPVLAERLVSLYDDHPHVEVLNGGTIGLGLIYLFECHDSLLFLDAVDADAEPGTVFKFTLEDLEIARSEKKLSSHQSDPYELMLYARTIGCLPKNVAVLGVQIDTIRPGIGLSEALLHKLERIEKNIVEEINGYLKTCMSCP